MRRHIMTAATVLAVAGLAAACGSSSGESATAATSTMPQPPLLSQILHPPATSTTTATSARNNIVKSVGESASIARQGEPALVEWTITSITVDPVCTQSIAVPPENGHFVVAAVTAETSPQFQSGNLPGGFHPMNNWAIVDADGVTQPHASTDAAFRCQDNDFPAFLAPGSRYSFHLMFDLRTPHGVLTFVPTPGQGGWEWRF